MTASVYVPVRAVWLDDGRGYICPSCYLYICVPKRELGPACPKGCRKLASDELGIEPANLIH